MNQYFLYVKSSFVHHGKLSNYIRNLINDLITYIFLTHKNVKIYVKGIHNKDVLLGNCFNMWNIQFKSETRYLKFMLRNHPVSKACI